MDGFFFCAHCVDNFSILLITIYILAKGFKFMILRVYFFKTLILALGVILLIVLFRSTDFWHDFYIDFLFPHLTYSLRLISNTVNFSIGDILYLTVILFSLRGVFRLIRSRGYLFSFQFIFALRFISITTLCFYVFWGFNYFIPSLSSRLNLKDDGYDKKILFNELEKEILNLNKLHKNLENNRDSTVTFKMTNQEIIQSLSFAYLATSEDLELPIYRRQSVKPSLLSTPLSYAGFSGYLNPFTQEAQYNYNSPKSSLPHTIAHEIAHQLGVAPENEANFVGLVACVNSSALELKYSARLTLLSYIYSQLALTNDPKLKEYLSQLRPGIIKEFTKRAAVWDFYKNPLEPYLKKGYDQYLKSNEQPSGIKSYSEFIGLWLAYQNKLNIS